ncbi:hypothetical protein ACFOWX_07330 [Sphingorhabdus arenilitoris]|uniref:DUF11 domain-containing protein n=1 Tax=Sphingorhabdus arenilitoris TaxID=1490041 RepID=A0ABV8RG47_9SPHN
MAATIMGGLCLASPAFAAGTLAGTDIENMATASYETPGGTIQIDSNLVVIKVDELLDVTVTNSDPGDIPSSPGATANVQRFLVTNTGNGEEAFRLTPNLAVAGDDFDPALQNVVLDSNGNGVYDPGVDTVYTAGTNDPVLQPDQSITVFVISSTPATVNDGNRAEVSLSVAATTGTGAPGTTFTGAGNGGGDAVVGTTGADADDNGFLAVQAAILSLVKSAVVADPFGGSRAVPGSTITYTLVATITGSGSLTNVVISDPIPADTQYVPGSITLDAATLTDAADTDQGNFNGSQVRAAVRNIAAGETRTVTFRVVIQ